MLALWCQSIADLNSKIYQYTTPFWPVQIRTYQQGKSNALLARTFPQIDSSKLVIRKWGTSRNINSVEIEEFMHKVLDK